MKTGRWLLPLITMTALLTALLFQRGLQTVSASLNGVFHPWSAEIVVGAETPVYQSSLALNSDDYPHILYWEGDDYDLIYAEFDGLNWINETVHTTGLSGQSPRIALDSNGNPHIIWFFDHDAMYGYHDGSSWHLIPICQGCWPGMGSLVLDSNDRPHVSFYMDTNDDLYYGRLDGSSWHIERVDGCSDLFPPAGQLSLLSPSRTGAAQRSRHWIRFWVAIIERPAAAWGQQKKDRPMAVHPPAWLNALVDAVANCIEPYSPMGPLGFRYLTEEDMTELIVYVTPIELVGGANDGEVVTAGFMLDLGALQAAFEQLDALHWQAQGFGPDDPEGPYLSLEGVFQDHAVWLRILAEPPADEEPGLQLDVSAWG